ncbi:MAG TPA: DUF1499 domain-containing protein [Candidatus Acidoferrales bacterium]|nr:DUF1499 domain-containing protein [Candidatus Acidoferrales bacterium]
MSSLSNRLGVAAVIAFVGGPLLAHLQVLAALHGFVLFALGGLLGLITLIVGLIGLVRSGFAAVRSGVLTGLVLTAVFVLSAARGRNVPRINDITTDTADPPKFVRAPSLDANKGRDMSYPGESFAQQQRQGYPTLAGLRMPGSPDDVFKRVETVAQQHENWELTRVDPSVRALEGVATTRLFRFQDDFVVEVRPQDGGSVVQMRSKSRDGKGDVGANAARIEGLFAELK